MHAFQAPRFRRVWGLEKVRDVSVTGNVGDACVCVRVRVWQCVEITNEIWQVYIYTVLLDLLTVTLLTR